MFEKHLSKSDILSKDAGRWPTSSSKMSLFHTCFSNIFIRKWNIDQKWVKLFFCFFQYGWNVSSESMEYTLKQD